jgi:hypothetical protein
MKEKIRTRLIRKNGSPGQKRLSGYKCGATVAAGEELLACQLARSGFARCCDDCRHSRLGSFRLAASFIYIHEGGGRRFALTLTSNRGPRDRQVRSVCRAKEK